MAFEAKVVVHDALGLHARPAGQIAKLVRDSGIDAEITNQDGQTASASSALRLLALKIKSGQEVTITVHNDNAAAPAFVAQIAEFLKG